MTSKQNNPNPWWGSFELPSLQSTQWSIGPLRLYVFNDGDEWRLGYHHSDVPLDDELILQKDVAIFPGDKVKLQKFVVSSEAKKFQLLARVADRPVVSHAESAFHVMPKSSITVYLSTPVWVEVKIDETSLIHIPSFRPSDSWFGPNTITGELCYTSITMVRYKKEILPKRCNRATTQLNIRNNGSDPLIVKSLKLPTPNLSLYVDPENQLWTQSLSVERAEDGTMAKIRLDDGPPQEEGPYRLVSSPRDNISRNMFVRALDALLKQSQEYHR
ncbi:MAG: hypothetical protein VYC39_11910 [Myxococcota bacterium]|nr:hypothetical protein [Myxococcota bacterium]